MDGSFYKRTGMLLPALFSLLLFSHLVLAKSSSIQNDHTYIGGELPFLNDGDSVKLILTQFRLLDHKTDVELTAIVKDRKFTFKLAKIKKPFSFNFKLPSQGMDMKNSIQRLNRVTYTIIPGDSVYIKLQNERNHFTGRNAGAYNCTYELDCLDRELNQKVSGLDVMKGESMKIILENNDLIRVQKLRMLERFKQSMDPLSFQLIRSNTIYSTEIEKFFWLNLKQKKASEIGYSLNSQQKMDSVDSFVLENLRIYPEFVIQKFKYDSCTVPGRKYTLGSCYRYIDRFVASSLKERCLTYLLIGNLKSDSLTKYRNIALANFTNMEYKTLIERLTRSRIEGATAYNFTLTGKDGQRYSLSDFEGKVVVLDFWFTGCGPCKQMTPKLGKISDQFSKSPVAFLSICTDKDEAVWKKSIQSGDYTFDNSIKLFTDGQQTQHPIIQNFNVEGYPTIIVIDTEGKRMRSPIDPRLDEGQDIEQLINEGINKKRTNRHL